MQTSATYSIKLSKNRKIVIESILKRDSSKMQIKVNQLEIYTEKNQLDPSKDTFEIPLRLYLLKPYDLKILMNSENIYRAKNDIDTKSFMKFEGTKYFDL